MSIRSLNPATGEVEKTFEEWSPAVVAETMEAVATAWTDWKRTTPEERAAWLRKVATCLRERSDELVGAMAREMGKPVAEGEQEVNKCAMICEFYAEHGAGMLAPEPVEEACHQAYVTYDPLGTVLAVMPWNFPYWQVFRIAAPTLMAGNTMVLKHSSNVPQCALLIESIFRDAELPANVFRTLLIGAGQVENVLQHPSVAGVCLTGSDKAGSAVASVAGRHLKKSVMELGGSDPFILLPDADMDAALCAATQARCRNTGQTCIAPKRFIVMDEVHDDFVARLQESMKAFRVGDPLDPETELGPMASTALRQELQEQVSRCVAAGGTVLCGGTIPEGPGAYYPATIITGIPHDAPVCQEEMFGPVALVFRVHSEEEAIALANNTPYGLGGSVWTADVEKGLRMAGEIQAGIVFVNGMVRSDPYLPFGGIKNSGYGRELAAYGLREFTNVKAVCLG